MDMTNLKKNKGFIVLIAVMVTTIILTIGMGVLNLALREFILANMGRDSVKAFYAADTGVDCAFNYDVLSAQEGHADEPYFASPLPGVTNPPSGSKIICNKQTLFTGPAYRTVPPVTCTDSNGVQHQDGCIITTLSRMIPNGPLATSALCIATSISGACVGPCVAIQVKKIKLTDETQETQIIANGISDCQSERSVERSLVLTWGATN